MASERVAGRKVTVIEGSLLAADDVLTGGRMSAQSTSRNKLPVFLDPMAGGNRRPHRGRSRQEATALKQTLQVAVAMDHICRRSQALNCRFDREFVPTTIEEA